MPAASCLDRTQRVSVLLSTFNRADMLGAAIDSLLAQTHPPFQLIVVDDGSTDRTPEVARSFGTRVTYLRKANAGKSRALNFALPHVAGNWVWFFDDDDVALPNANELRLRLLAESGARWVVSRYLWGKAGEDGRLLPGRQPAWPDISSAQFFTVLLRSCVVSLNSALIGAEVLRRAGPFDEGLIRSQDYDMLLRLARLSPPAMLDAPTFIARQHAGPRGSAALRFSAGERERKAAEFDGRIGRKIRKSVGLAEYLYPSPPEPLSEAQCRAALLARIGVMASKGLLAEFIEDARLLASAVSATPGRPALTPDERTALIVATQEAYLSFAWLSAKADTVRQLAAVGGTPAGKQVLRAIARGLVGRAKWGRAGVQSRARLLLLAARITARSLSTT